jgi:hypothetical protein
VRQQLKQIHTTLSAAWRDAQATKAAHSRRGSIAMAPVAAPAAVTRAGGGMRGQHVTAERGGLPKSHPYMRVDKRGERLWVRVPTDKANEVRGWGSAGLGLVVGA